MYDRARRRAHLQRVLRVGRAIGWTCAAYVVWMMCADQSTPRWCQTCGAYRPSGHTHDTAPTLFDREEVEYHVPVTEPVFGGETYEPAFDVERLAKQSRRVFELMRDGQWRTLRAIADELGDPEASVSARLRDFRKAKFGGFTVERRRVGDASRGINEYRIVKEGDEP